MTSPFHLPVMLDEVEGVLRPAAGETLVDGTVGGGGHAERLARALAPGGRLVIADRDAEALAAATGRLAGVVVPVVALHCSFAELPERLEAARIDAVNGVLLDLGVSSHQLDTPDRGFSFRSDGPLDMRMDPTAGEAAADVVARLDERDLARVLWDLGEERWARRIARAIVDRRRAGPIVTTRQLADIVRGALPGAASRQSIHPATRTFMALRLLVNDELSALERALPALVNVLAPAGRIAVLSYHSLEDRITKRSFQRLSGRCQCPPGIPECRCEAWPVVEVLTRRPLTPSAEEVAHNPRARSAKLRAARKLGDAPVR